MLKEIKRIMLAYPYLKFVLIDDSGQEDPKIYRGVIKEFSARINNGKACRTRCTNRLNNYAGCSCIRTGKKGRHWTGTRERRRHYFIKEMLHQSMKHFF